MSAAKVQPKWHLGMKVQRDSNEAAAHNVTTQKAGKRNEKNCKLEKQ